MGLLHVVSQKSFEFFRSRNALRQYSLASATANSFDRTWTPSHVNACCRTSTHCGAETDSMRLQRAYKNVTVNYDNKLLAPVAG